ncbi:MAG: hypothetical protein LH606_19920, partial [Cytophagaceae bacterium]|nr:hypothetical protein [Cytophagaceae bacterium]
MVLSLRINPVFSFGVLWCLLLAGLPALAQNGRFNVRFVQKSINCTDKKLQVQVQVKAHSTGETFRMGNANFRFDYDPRQIKNPVLKTEDAFSNSDPAKDTNYDAQTLGKQEGTTLATASLNIFYSGSGKDARLVGTDWLSIASLEFDIVAANSCIALIWHTDQMFPVTGLSQVLISSTNPFTYSTKSVAAGGIFGNQCILVAPNATLTGGGSISLGQSATLSVAFTGNGPFSFSLSDGTNVSNTSDNPKTISLSPGQTTTYSLSSVSNACGNGTASGTATITLAGTTPSEPTPPPPPTSPPPPPPSALSISIADFDPGLLCAGDSVTVAFSPTGNFGAGNVFSLQLSDASGTNFTGLSGIRRLGPTKVRVAIPPA